MGFGSIVHLRFVSGTTLIHDLRVPLPGPLPILAMQIWALILLKGQYLIYTLRNRLFLSHFFFPPHFCSVPRKLCLFNKSISSAAHLCPTLCDPTNHSMPGLPVHHQLPEFTQTHAIESVMPSSHLILCCLLLLLPTIPPNIRVFSNESAICMRWPKYWEFQLQHQSYQ